MGKDFYTKKICGIYLITNTKNGMKYCGQSVDITQRWKQHTTPNKSVIGTAIAKDVESFTFKILEQCPREMLNEREKYYIEIYVCLHPYGYNMTSGGGSKTTYIDATKKKISVALTGKAHTPERTAKKIGKGYFKDHIHTEESKTKISEAMMGHTFSEESKSKMSASRIGKVQSAETIAKRVASIRLACQKRKMDKTYNNEGTK